jgi:hypothetical protein
MVIAKFIHMADSIPVHTAVTMVAVTRQLADLANVRLCCSMYNTIIAN